MPPFHVLAVSSSTPDPFQAHPQSTPQFSVTHFNLQQLTQRGKSMPNVYEVITSRIIKQLESGTAPWQKPWKASGSSGLPRNLITNREYRGINVWILLSNGYASPCWLTFRQARDHGGYVRHGEVGIPVVYWKFGKRELLDGDEIIEKPSVLCRYYTVFNVEQCEGLKIRPAEPVENQSQAQAIEACEQVVSAWLGKPTIRHGGDSASYSKIVDCVQMPERTCFDSVEEYYSTLFHELTHSSGHPNRLNRSSLTDFERFGDQNYSREELVAEMGAAFLCGITGIENKTINNSAAYLHSWLEALKNDSRLVLVAASQAQKAADLILNSSGRKDVVN
jgi:antirestriction protein ArdC